MKRLIGHDIGSYTFNATAGTVTFAGLPSFTLDQVLLITDALTGAIIYNFSDPACGGTLAGSVLTLEASMTGLASTDPLIIYLDLPEDGVPLLSGTLAVAGPGAAISTQGQKSVVLQLGGAWNGSLWIEGSNDQSSGSWGELMVMSLDEFIAQDFITENGQYVLKVSTLYIRVNVQAISGTANVSMVGRASIGDYGADRLSMALDQSTGIALSVLPGQGGQQTSKGSLPVTIASDQALDLLLTGPGNVAQLGLNALTGSLPPIDTMTGGTTSYRSFLAQINGSAGISAGAITFQGSNDGLSWHTVPVYDQDTITGSPIQAAISISASTSRAFSGKCIYRYLKAAITTAFTGGFIQAITRLSINDITPQVIAVGQSTAANLQSQVSTNPTGGVAGVLAMGGNIAVGTAPTANPAPVGGIDTSGKTRMALTDTAGRFQVDAMGLDNAGLARQIGALPPAGSPANVPALPAQIVGVADQSQSMFDLLQQMLLEQKITNQFLSELPRLLNAAVPVIDEPDAFRQDPTLFVS
jgi:hypothetical protein